MLLLVTAIKLVAEIALMCLLGRLLLGLLAGQKREQNLIYQALSMVTRPLERGVRAVAPKAVLDRHIPLATGGVLLWIWVLAVMGKVVVCGEAGVAQCLPQ